MAGAALGQAVGDALGFPVERQGPEAADSFAAAWLSGAPGPEPMRDGFPVGQVSDDTQCAQVLVGVALRLGRHDRAEHAAALVRSVDALVGSGSNTRRMLRGLASAPGFAEGDLDRALAGRDAALAHAPHLPTNGVAMRAWPHAVLHADRDALADSVLADAALTHANPESGACAVTCALATRLLFEGVAVSALLDRLEREMPSRGELASLVLARRLLGLGPRAAADAVWSVSGEPPEWRSVSPAGVDVEVGVELAQPDPVPACLEEGAEGRRRKPLAQRRDDPAGDEDVPCHGGRAVSHPARFGEWRLGLIPR